MFDVMNVTEEFSFSKEVKVVIWDDGTVVFDDCPGDSDIAVSLEELESFVSQARAWIRAREVLKDRGTQP